MLLNEITTLEEAKQVLRDNWEKGIDCPCCNRLVKQYKRSFNSGMAYALIRAYAITEEDNPDNGWLQIQHEFAKRYGQNATAMSYSILKWWDLLETNPVNSDESKKGSGYWRITDKGKRFVRGEIKIPRQVYVYDNKCVGFSDDLVSIREALGVKFDYQELMSGAV